MSANKSDIDMAPQFDLAEAILARSGMHPVMAHSVIEFARYGERHGTCAIATASSVEASGAESVDLLTTRQAAMRLGVSDKQIYRLVLQGRLRNHVFGRQHRFAIRDLDALIQQTSSSARATRMSRLMHEERRAA